MATPTTDAIDNAVRIEVYRSFIERGHPPVPAEIARALGEPVYEVESSLTRLAEAHVLVLAPGTPYVWMANPLSALPTPYRARVAGRDWWGNCIWDVMGIVGMLGGEGEIRSFCPDCAEELTVSLSGERADHPGYIVHFAVPAAHWWEDIGFN